ncbi:acetyltransferase [Arthrobacter sp. BHU FT2]|nr:acetyltransferase [Arthrobacter sp. BHU FT2]
MSELILIAASGLAREVLAMVRGSGQYDVVGLLDDDEGMLGTTVDGASVLGGIDEAARFRNALLLVCLMSGRAREAVVERLRGAGIGESQYATAIDPSVHCPEGCSIGRGSILLRNVTMTASVTLGAHVVAMPSVTMMHDTKVADFGTLGAGVSLGGGANIGRAANLEMNASVRALTTVGDYSTIAMGSAVRNNVPSGTAWGGVPAHRLVRYIRRPSSRGN